MKGLGLFFFDELVSCSLVDANETSDLDGKEGVVLWFEGSADDRSEFLEFLLDTLSGMAVFSVPRDIASRVPALSVWV